MSEAAVAAPERIVIPAGLRPCRRPVRQRANQDPGRPGRGAGCGRAEPARHLAPAGAGTQSGAAGPRGPGDVVRARLMTTWWCSATAGRRRSGTSAAFGSDLGQGAAPELRRVLVQVRQRHAGRAVACRAERSSPPSPAAHPLPQAEAGHRRVRAHAQRDLDRRRDADPPGAGRGRRRHWSSSTRPARRAASPSTQPSSTRTTSPRRSASAPTAACGSRCCHRPRSSAQPRIDASDRYIPAFLSLQTAIDNSSCSRPTTRRRSRR